MAYYHWPSPIELYFYHTMLITYLRYQLGMLADHTTKYLFSTSMSIPRSLVSYPQMQTVFQIPIVPETHSAYLYACGLIMG